MCAHKMILHPRPLAHMQAFLEPMDRAVWSSGDRAVLGAQGMYSKSQPIIYSAPVLSEKRLVMLPPQTRWH